MHGLYDIRSLYTPRETSLLRGLKPPTKRRLKLSGEFEALIIKRFTVTPHFTADRKAYHFCHPFLATFLYTSYTIQALYATGGVGTMCDDRNQPSGSLLNPLVVGGGDAHSTREASWTVLNVGYIQ